MSDHKSDQHPNYANERAASGTKGEATGAAPARALDEKSRGFQSPVLAWFDRRLRERANVRLPGHPDVIVTGLTADGRHLVCDTDAEEGKTYPAEPALIDQIMPQLV